MRHVLGLGLALLLLAPLARSAAAQDMAARRDTVRPDTTSVEARVAEMTDRVPEVRVRAAYALAELGPAAAGAVPALRAALGDENAVVRYAAVWALGEIGPAARPATAELEAHAKSDPIGDVRWVAAKVLRRLRAPAPPAAGRPDEAGRSRRA